MTKKFNLTEQDKTFIDTTSAMLKDIMYHSIASYTKKDGDPNFVGILVNNILVNMVGNALNEISPKDGFLHNLEGFSRHWQDWVKNVTPQVLQQLEKEREDKKGVH